MSTMTRRKNKSTKDDASFYITVATEDNAEGGGKKKVSKKMRKKRKKDVEPFLITNLKVGSVIAVVGLFSYALYIITTSAYSKLRHYDGEPQNAWSQYVNDDAGGGYTGGTAGAEERTKIFPTFDTNDDQITAFDVTDPSIKKMKHKDDESDPKQKSFLEVIDAMDTLKKEFVSAYGGENAAREILNRGIITFSPSDPSDNGEKIEGIRNIARRIFHAKNDKNSFELAFAGSSAVAGYGNLFQQTFPIVLGNILTDSMALLGIELKVRNAAIADISSFPYGWCLDTFMGKNVDVVSWDSSLMNRADTDAAFESYLRRVVSMESSPMLIVREAAYSKSRRQILQKYVDLGVLVNPIVINIDAAAEPFLPLHEDIIPEGFKDWLEFGAPPGAPGKVRSGRTTRLSVKQHELVAWLISMHFITAIELGAAHIMGVDNGTDGDWFKNDEKESKQKVALLPKPQAEIVNFNSPLMFGRPTDEEAGFNSTEWKMDDMYCRTTFEPIVSGNLEELVVSGTSSEDLDLLFPRGPLLYNKDWVMDLGFEAKQHAFSYIKYDFKYQYKKKAYYGTRPSGNMTMFVPFIEKEGGSRFGLNSFHKRKKPSEVFGSLVLCEVNEHVGEKQCNMVDSMGYNLGGTNVKAQYIESNGVSYQGKKICVRMDVPASAKWTTRAKLEKKMLDKGLRQKSNSNEYGLSLEISVTDKFIFWKNGPCSLSHVLWEQK